jgi:hypothetical protein
MNISLGALEGMVIGSVNPIIITADTPINPDQWQDGIPWHVKKGTELGEYHKQSN